MTGLRSVEWRYPLAAQPVYDTTAAQPVTYASAAPIAGGKYTVKKGDTLWGVAQRTYGNGNQYKKITAANPQIKNDTLIAGAVITLP